MTVLVTGAGGFLGSDVTELLVAAGERTRVLIRPGERVIAPPGAELDVYVGDVADRAILEAALSGVERVLHCAARTGPWGAPAEYERTNVQGLDTLIRTALAARVQRLVHVSSATVHGIDVGGEADEGAPLRDEPNPYCRSKVAGERLIERLVREAGAPVTVVRPGWVYGPRDIGSFARIARMIETRRIVMAGAGHNHLPLIYVRDAARAVLLASVAAGAEGRAYLVVDDQLVTQRDYVEAIAAELGAPPPTRWIPYRAGVQLAAVAEGTARLLRTRRPPPVTRFGLKLLGGENRFVIDRARRELGFSPLVHLAEGVRRSAEWYRDAYHAPTPDREVGRNLEGAHA